MIPHPLETTEYPGENTVPVKEPTIQPCTCSSLF